MIQYPDGRKKTYQTAAASAANRGMDLEKDINITNTYYLDTDRAVIHKKPTPIQIVKVDYPRRSAAKITEAYFKIPSTTDYNGVYRNRAIDFEAKECASSTSFPLKSIHMHQIRHLEAVMRHGAIAFVIVRFTLRNETYFIDAKKIVAFWNKAERKSIPYTWFVKNGSMIPYNYVKPVDYLSTVDQFYFEGDTNDSK